MITADATLPDPAPVVEPGARSPLRSIDWRFLLPAPPGPGFDSLIVRGAEPAIIDLLLRTGTASIVRTTHALDQPADAIAVLDGSFGDLRALARCLRPGGVLYLSIAHAARMDWYERLRDELLGCGLRVVNSYAVLSGLAQSQVYVPLESANAIAWYVRTLHYPDSLRACLRHAVLATLARLNPAWRRRLLRRVAITAVKVDRPGRLPALTMPAVLAHPAVQRLVGAERLDALLISGQRTVLLPFAPHTAAPVAVIKVPKIGSQNQATEDGHHALLTLRARLPQGVAETLPPPLGLFRHRDLSIAVEGYLPGESLERAASKRWYPVTSKIAVMQRVTRWLARFHAHTRSASSWSDLAIVRFVTAPAASYRRHLGLTATEEDLLQRAAGYASALRGTAMPLVGQHRDLRPVNIIGCRGGLAVLDWEGYCEGPPFCDLFHFLLQWHANARSLRTDAAKANGIERLLFAPATDRIGRATREAVMGYVHDVRLDGRLVPLLILYTLLELATRRAALQDREQSLSGGRRDNDNVAYLQVLAQERGRFLGAFPRGSLLDAVAGRGATCWNSAEAGR